MAEADGLGESATQSDFFVSYTAVDEPWAVWIAWWLELAGYRVNIQAWDFRPGHNFPLMMNRGITLANQTILVLSPSFIEASFTQPEWAAAFGSDPTGMERKLVPVRVKSCNPAGLLKQIVWIDLVDVDDEHRAVVKLLDGVRAGRGKPSVRPGFPASPFGSATTDGSPTTKPFAA